MYRLSWSNQTATPPSSAARAAALMGVLLLTVSACKKENTVNVSGSGGAATAVLPELPDCASEAGPAPGSAGPEMIPAGLLDGTCFWIDETEVTVAQYDAFLTSTPDPADQDSLCSWNAAFESPAECTPGGDDADVPVTCVDWCDARAYCEFAGKTLCQDAIDKPDNAEFSSWYSACSNGQQTNYPYGNNYLADSCNGSEFSGGVALRSITEVPSCTTDVGVLHLSGNAAEWVDACGGSTGAGDDCLLRGGSYKSPGNALHCAKANRTARDTTRADVGFRCCVHPG